MHRFCLIALSCVALGILASAAPGPETTVYKGVISDKRCGAAVDAACNKKCFDEGETPVLVVDGTGAVMDIKNGEKVTSMPGMHVEITGTLDQKKNLVVVEVKPLK
jgi:hypothetical protein